MSSPRLLDLFCCEGGASMGYANAGFKVSGVDIEKQPRYPFRFHERDALHFLERFGMRFDAIHASPPCQAFTKAQRLQGNEHPDLIGPVRELLKEIGKPYVIENVVGAPLLDPLMLCGGMFGLRTYRHRLFESNIDLTAPIHGEHVSRTTKMGRKVIDGEFMHVIGHFSGIARAREAMGMPWASRDGLAEAVPPAYTEHIGKQLLHHIESERAA
jgi:DNA (cytosine-5)-methyltransferase 1